MEKKQRLGFTLIELLLGMMLLVLISAMVSFTLTAYMSFFKVAKDDRERSALIEDALDEIVFAIHRSAWIEFTDSNSITLHSHSPVGMKSYYLRDGNLYTSYFDGREERDRILLRNVYSEKLFEKAGYDKNASCSSMARILIRDAKNNKRLYFQTAGVKECWQWDFGAGRAEIRADGTAVYPFAGLDDLAAKGTDRQGPPYGVKGVLSGAHRIAGAFSIKKMGNMAFSGSTSLTLAPGAVLSLGPGARLSTGGRFSSAGDKQSPVKIYASELSSSGFSSSIGSLGYEQIYVTNANADISDYHVSYTDFRGGRGLIFRSCRNPGMNIKFADNALSLFWPYGLVIKDVKNAEVSYNKFSTGGWYSVNLYMSNIYHVYNRLWQPRYGEVNYSFLNNIFERNNVKSVELSIAAAKNILKVDMDFSNNYFKNTSGGIIGGAGGSWWANYPVEFKILNNYFENCSYAISGGVGGYCDNALQISGNTILSCGYGIVFTVGQGRGLIEKNIVKATTSAMAAYGIFPAQGQIPEVVLRNNIFSGGSTLIDLPGTYQTHKPKMTFQNNVFYDCGTVNYKTSAHPVHGDQGGGVIFKNNTFDRVFFSGQAGYYTIEDCIIWGDAGVDYVASEVLARAEDSDIIGASVPGKRIIDITPDFISRTGRNYDLNTDLEFGPGVPALIGAYEGEYASGMEEAIGAHPEAVGPR